MSREVKNSKNKKNGAPEKKTRARQSSSELNDYGLEHFAAHDGWSSEASARFERIVSLSRKADELGVNAICALENSDQKVANAVKDSAKNKELKILTLDSMQSCDPDNRKEYCEIMEDNLNVLKELLDY